KPVPRSCKRPVGSSWDSAVSNDLVGASSQLEYRQRAAVALFGRPAIRDGYRPDPPVPLGCGDCVLLGADPQYTGDCDAASEHAGGAVCWFLPVLGAAYCGVGCSPGAGVGCGFPAKVA